ncbi:MAG TPA: hypothetical protein VGF28_04220 [Thermoanaerobaculia bacterium]|jgi:hypothetical protein
MTTTTMIDSPPVFTQSASPVPSLLTSPTPVQLNTVGQSTTDGFMLATLQENENGDRSFTYGLNDPSSNPSTVRACASQHYYVDEDRYVVNASFLMPAPSGLSYVIGEDTTSGFPSATAQFMALNLQGMQAWQVVALNNPTVATQDGFVVAWVDGSGDDGSRGSITGAQILGVGPSIVAGSSQHLYADGDVFVPCNSFMMPVCNGTTYQINTTITSDNPVFGAAFVPLDPSVFQLGTVTERNAGSIYQAQTDGFLVAYLSANEDGDRASVDLYSNSNQNPVSSAPLASTSIHLYSNADIYVPFNTVTIPVQSGNYYTASFTPTSGNPAIALWWVPITATP